MKLLRISLARACVSGRGLQDLQGDGLVDGADIGSGLGGPDDLLHESLSFLVRHFLPVGRRQTELSQSPLMGNGLVMLEPLVGFCNRFAFGST